MGSGASARNGTSAQKDKPKQKKNQFHENEVLHLEDVEDVVDQPIDQVNVKTSSNDARASPEQEAFNTLTTNASDAERNKELPEGDTNSEHNETNGNGLFQSDNPVGHENESDTGTRNDEIKSSNKHKGNGDAGDGSRSDKDQTVTTKHESVESSNEHKGHEDADDGSRNDKHRNTTSKHGSIASSNEYKETENTDDGSCDDNVPNTTIKHEGAKKVSEDVTLEGEIKMVERNNKHGMDSTWGPAEDLPSSRNESVIPKSDKKAQKVEHRNTTDEQLENMHRPTNVHTPCEDKIVGETLKHDKNGTPRIKNDMKPSGGDRGKEKTKIVSKQSDTSVDFNEESKLNLNKDSSECIPAEDAEIVYGRASKIGNNTERNNNNLLSETNDKPAMENTSTNQKETRQDSATNNTTIKSSTNPEPIGNSPPESNQQKSSIDDSKPESDGRNDNRMQMDTLGHRDDNKRLNANLEFYQNRIRSRPAPGHYIEEMLEWFGDFQQLERNHRYIQWLFPLYENSGMNSEAQALQIHEAEAIQADRKAHGRVLKAFKMMLHFYGMKLDTHPATKVSRADRIWKERYLHLNKSTHNYLRITRILQSISFLGYQPLQYPWLQFILKESHSKDTLLPNLRGGSIKYWIDSLSDSDEQEKAIQFLTMPEAKEKHSNDEKKMPNGKGTPKKEESNNERGVNSGVKETDDNTISPRAPNTKYKNVNSITGKVNVEQRHTNDYSEDNGQGVSTSNSSSKLESETKKSKISSKDNRAEKHKDTKTSTETANGDVTQKPSNSGTQKQSGDDNTTLTNFVQGENPSLNPSLDF